MGEDNLFDWADTYFDGETYEPDKDKARLTGQLLRVFDLMGDGHWHTLRWLSDHAMGSEASVSARLRDLRKDRFGGFNVERHRLDGGLWEYRLVAQSIQSSAASPGSDHQTTRRNS